METNTSITSLSKYKVPVSTAPNTVDSPKSALKNTIGTQILAVYILFVVKAQYTKTTTEQHFLWSHLSGCNNGVCHIAIDESDPAMEFWTQQTSAYYYVQHSHVMCKLKTSWQSKGDHPILTHSLCKNGCSIQSMTEGLTPSRWHSI